MSEEVFLLRVYLWAQPVPWSEEQTEELVSELATFLSERGFENQLEGPMRSLIAAGRVEVPDDPDKFVTEVQEDASLIMIPSSGAT